MSLYGYGGSLVFSPKKGERYQVCLDDILFLEHHGKKVIIHTVNKRKRQYQYTYQLLVCDEIMNPSS